MSRREWRQRRNRVLRHLHKCMNDPQLVRVWATEPVAAEIGEGYDDVDVMPGPGRVIVFWFQRAKRNVEVIALDDEGGDTARLFTAWVLEDGGRVDRILSGSGSPEPEPFKA